MCAVAQSAWRREPRISRMGTNGRDGSRGSDPQITQTRLPLGTSGQVARINGREKAQKTQE